MRTIAEQLMLWYGSEFPEDEYTTDWGDWISLARVDNFDEQVEFLAEQEHCWDDLLEPGFWLIWGDSQGFVWGERYPNRDGAQEAYDKSVETFDSLVAV